jgi:hypothetical protein
MTVSKRLSAPGAILLAGLLALSLGEAVLAKSEDHESRADILAGTWRVELRQSDCVAGVQGPPFQSFLTFDGSGTLIGTTMAPAFLAGQRSPDHGIWNHKHGEKYTAASEAFLLFDSEPRPPFPGFRAGTQRISQDIELKNRDEFTSAAVVEFFDTTGNIVMTGCANAIGRRFK